MGVCENQIFFCTLLTFWADFQGIFGTQKMLMCTLFLRGEGGLRKCMVCSLMKMLTFMDGP